MGEVSNRRMCRQKPETRERMNRQMIWGAEKEKAKTNKNTVSKKQEFEKTVKAIRHKT